MEMHIRYGMEAALLFSSYSTDIFPCYLSFFTYRGPDIDPKREFLFNRGPSFLLTDVIVLGIVCSHGVRASITSRDSSTGASCCWASVESDCFSKIS